MLPQLDLHTKKQYLRQDCAVFFRVKQQWGQLANPHSGFPLPLSGITIGSTEHLYQALRFPDRPDFQQAVLSTKGAIPAKRCAYQEHMIGHTSPEWVEGHLNVRAMIVVTALKLALYPESVGTVLDASENMPIVEQSSHDPFWGARTIDGSEDGEQLLGCNVLGQIWMLHREHAHEDLASYVHKQDMQGLRLLGVPLIEYLSGITSAEQQAALF